MSTCRYCGAPVVWAITDVGGKPMPLDPGAAPAGNVVVLNTSGRDLIVRVMGTGAVSSAPPERRRMPHFATCPKLKEARNR